MRPLRLTVRIGDRETPAIGTRVKVYVPVAPPKRLKSVRDLPIFGMWADRDDIPDGVAYVNRLRAPRY
jgi:hypothetical protein